MSKSVHTEPIPKEDFFWYKAKIVSIYDGDTVRVDIDLGMNIWAMNQKIRLAGIDTPELRGSEREDGLRAKEYLKDLIHGRELMILTTKDKTGKYGRYLAELWVQKDEESGGDWINVNDALVKSGHAKVLIYK